MQPGFDGVPFASKIFIEDVETLNMVIDDGLSEFLTDAGEKNCDDEDYSDAIEESEENCSSKGMLEELSFSNYIFHKWYTVRQSYKVQSTGGENEVYARAGGEESLAEH